MNKKPRFEIDDLDFDDGNISYLLASVYPYRIYVVTNIFNRSVKFVVTMRTDMREFSTFELAKSYFNKMVA